jgi:microcystin-dependent protein
MTISTTQSTVAYVANGVATSFVYPFKVLASDDLQVYLNEVLQVSGYTLTGVGADVGGTVVFTVAPLSGVDVFLTRVIIAVQLSDYRPFDPFPAERVEDDFDRVVMLCQQFLNGYVKQSGDTMRGFLTLHADPVDAMHAATKNFVENFAAGAFSTTYQSNATGDAAATVEAGWNAQAAALGITRAGNETIFYRWKSTDNAVYRYVGNQAGPAWATVVTDWPQSVGVAEAPVDGQTYGRKNSTWEALVPKAGGTFTGHIEVPAGAIGAQVPQAQTVIPLTQKGAANGVAPLGADGLVPIANGGIPVGTILDYAGAAVPGGYFPCNGSAVSRTSYAALYAALGGAASPWGQGDGTTTFNVPDLQRRTTIGSGGVQISGPAVTVGSVGGEEAHVQTLAEMVPHTHNVGTSNTVQGGAPLTAVPGNANTPSGSAGGGAASNIMQPSAVVNKIIKA